MALLIKNGGPGAREGDPQSPVTWNLHFPSAREIWLTSEGSLSQRFLMQSFSLSPGLKDSILM